MTLWVYCTTTTGWGKTYPRHLTTTLDDLTDAQVAALRGGESVVVRKITGGHDLYEPCDFIPMVDESDTFERRVLLTALANDRRIR